MNSYKTTELYLRDLARDPTLAVVSRRMAASALNLSKATIDRQIEDKSLESVKIDAVFCVRAQAIIDRLNHGDEQIRTVKSFLLNVAQKGEATTYEPVMAAIGLPTRSPPNRKRIGTILGDISRESYEKDGFLLSALVFNKTLGRPSDSFYLLAEELGDQLADDYLDKQLRKIWRHYGRKKK